MRVIYNNIIPFKGFKAINICTCLFVRKGCYMSEKDFNHERIHSEQMKELLYIGFYLWYFIEWLIRLFKKGNAYRNISFEKEAYNNDADLFYLDKRKPYAWMDYL